MTVIHDLKTVPEMFEAVCRGTKTAEFRKNDRHFDVGDILILREYQSTSVFKGYLGREIRVRVTHIVLGPDFGVPEGYAMLSFKRE